MAIYALLAEEQVNEEQQGVVFYVWIDESQTDRLHALHCINLDVVFSNMFKR